MFCIEILFTFGLVNAPQTMEYLHNELRMFPDLGKNGTKKILGHSGYAYFNNSVKFVRQAILCILLDIHITMNYQKYCTIRINESQQDTKKVYFWFWKPKSRQQTDS